MREPSRFRVELRDSAANLLATIGSRFGAQVLLPGWGRGSAAPKALHIETRGNGRKWVVRSTFWELHTVDVHAAEAPILRIDAQAGKLCLTTQSGLEVVEPERNGRLVRLGIFEGATAGIFEGRDRAVVVGGGVLRHVESSRWSHARATAWNPGHGSVTAAAHYRGRMLVAGDELVLVDGIGEPRPRPLSRRPLARPVTQLWVFGSMAIVSTGSELSTFDLDDGLRPRGSIGMPAATMITRWGPYAYAPSDDGGTEIIDVTTPSGPTRVGSYTTRHWSQDTVRLSEDRFARLSPDRTRVELLRATRRRK